MPRLSTRPRAVLFDLDGTITDPEAGITRCLAHAFRECGLPVPSHSELRLSIGPPWEDYLHSSMGVPQHLVETMLETYRHEYDAGGVFEATVYDGLHDLIAMLHADGFEVALATSKPLPAATRVIEHFGFAPYFTFLGGALLDGTRSHKADVIAHVLESLGHNDALMVGDRRYDIEGARAHGLACVSVSWGHAADGEVAAANPAATIATPAELRTLLHSLPIE